ncbi:hypothetical protein GCM10010532_004400 [Dactylosporangium siamense]|uniref:Uncharacterized protein n=1 Tax=Dactylosporangium siamense TaxID=685454 RepID=A0A919PTB4_9ACTN|nr:hypothetical protein Dsi01nite_073630 [Dactylosporangium siamense]
MRRAATSHRASAAPEPLASAVDSQGREDPIPINLTDLRDWLGTARLRVASLGTGTRTGTGVVGIGSGSGVGWSDRTATGTME